MKAFVLDRYCGAERLRAGDMPDPHPGEDDVLVRVHSAGVNLLDSTIRNGEFKRILPYRLPLIPGQDVRRAVGPGPTTTAYRRRHSRRLTAWLSW
jgi:NADPH:quinone reductase-like Zn-dependent oxidoreductase